MSHTTHAFSGCRWARIHSTCSGLSCQGAPLRLACSGQSTQLAWLAGTGISNKHTPAIPGQQALSVRSSTASEALDPGERRLFLLADQPGKPTDQEKSKYERYTPSITMVYPCDILADKRRDISLQRLQCLQTYQRVMMSMWIEYDKPSKDVVQLYKT